MKFRLFSAIALAGLMLGSCVTDENPSAGGSILAVMENDQTRTSVTDEGKFTWSDGDKVWLHTTSGHVPGTLSSGAGTSNATFSYDSYIGEMTGKAVYPFNTGHGISGDQLSVVLPASYDLGSNIGNTNAAMYAVEDNGKFKFKHLAGVMRFKFKDVPAGVNKFTITLDKKINGTFTADLNEEYPLIEASATSTASEKTITLNFNALTAKADISIYVPLPIGTYNSLELGLYDDGQAIWTYSKSVTNTVNRKSLILMPTVTLAGSVDGDIDDEDTPSDSQPGDYVDEYGVNHGQGTKIGETVWAPVNCGYHATDYKYGKLYQWGRKYGQGYSGDLMVDGNVFGTYTDAVVPTLEGGGVSVIIGNHKSKTDVFYIGTSQYNYNWMDSRNDMLWNSGTDSNPIITDYNPCPSGWRVPTKEELYALCGHFSSLTTNDAGQIGRWYSGSSEYSTEVPRVFLPAAGFRYYDGTAYRRGDYGRYWSSRAYDDAYNAYYLSFYGFTVRIDSDYRAYGYSVRCVQVTDEVAEP